MELIVDRKEFTEESTISDFVIDGSFFCFSLEDMVRDPGVKIDGSTAIPEGKYRVIIDDSRRFRRKMPHILDVPMFDGIRIHNGNTDKDTDGCILLGFTKSRDFVGESIKAFNKFFDLLSERLNKGEECWITIQRGVA